MHNSVQCMCGAQWFGRYCASVVIDAHRDRATRRMGGCRLVDHDTFAAAHKCKCAACALKRRRDSLKRKGLK